MGHVTKLDYQPAASRPDLLAPPVAAAVAAWAGPTPVDSIRVAEIELEIRKGKSAAGVFEIGQSLLHRVPGRIIGLTAGR